MLRTVANSFIKFYDDCNDSVLNLKEFLSQQYDDKSPLPADKLKVKYSENNSEVISVMREAIFKNMYLNSEFPEEVNRKDFEAFCELLRKTVDETNDVGDNEMAQLTLMLHLTKSSSSDSNIFFSRIISRINTIKVFSAENDDAFFKSVRKLNADLFSVVSSIKDNGQIHEISCSVVQKLTRKSIDFNFGEVNVKFFASNIDILNGFAGHQTIYISLDRLKYIYEMKKKEESVFIVVLECIRIIQHELTHVLLR